jgi:hypothetical protein
MILVKNILSRPSLMLKLNHGLSERGFPCEIHLLDGLLKKLRVNFLKAHNQLNAKVLD